MRWWAILAVVVLWTIALSGCAADQAVLDAERESEALIDLYAEGAETAVAGLLGAYEEVSLRELRAVVELALLEEEVDREVVTGRETTEDGVEIVHTSRERAIPPDRAREAVALALDRAAGVHAEAAAFRARWEGSRANLADALAIRSRIREYLRAGGVQPEHVDALADALARRLSRRGGE